MGHLSTDFRSPDARAWDCDPSARFPGRSGKAARECRCGAKCETGEGSCPDCLRDEAAREAAAQRERAAWIEAERGRMAALWPTLQRAQASVERGAGPDLKAAVESAVACWRTENARRRPRPDKVEDLLIRARLVRDRRR